MMGILVVLVDDKVRGHYGSKKEKKKDLQRRGRRKR